MRETTISEEQQVKVAATDNPVHKLILERWSARSFSDRPIEQPEIDTIFEAASWAPSSMNEQPWMYIYATKGTPTFDKMAETLMPGNQPWAKNASVLIASLARKNHANNGMANKYNWYDVGSANQNLLLQAASVGILGHVMGGFHRDKAEALLQLPDEIELVCLIALGYPAPADDLEEPFRSRELTPRNRNPLSAFVFQNNLK